MNPSMDALTANQTWQPPCGHGTYQHEAITSRSRQLLMMGTWLPEKCWATNRRETKNTKVTSSWFFLSTPIVPYLPICQSQNMKAAFAINAYYLVPRTDNAETNDTIAQTNFWYSSLAVVFCATNKAAQWQYELALGVSAFLRFKIFYRKEKDFWIMKYVPHYTPLG